MVNSPREKALHWIAALAVSVFMVSPTFGESQFSKYRPSLKGLRQLYVSVAVQDPNNKSGVDSSIIQTDVELKLREAGITIIPQSSSSAHLTVEVLLHPATVPAVTGEVEAYAFSIILKVSQWTYLARDQSIPCWSVTFLVVGTDSGPTSVVSTYIRRQGVPDLLNVFLNEY